MVGDALQRPAVQGAEGEGGQGTAHVVDLGVAVDGGDQGQAGGALEERPHQVAPGTVTVDDVIALLADSGPEGLEDRRGAAGQHVGFDAQRPGLLGEGPVGEAHHIRLYVFVQPLQKGVDVGFGPAGVPAADQMNDFHI